MPFPQQLLLLLPVLPDEKDLLWTFLVFSVRDWCGSWREELARWCRFPHICTPWGITHSQPSPISSQPCWTLLTCVQVSECCVSSVPARWVLHFQHPVRSRSVVNFLCVQLLPISRLGVKFFTGLPTLLYLQPDTKMPLCPFILFPPPRATFLLISKHQNPPQILHTHQNRSSFPVIISQLPPCSAALHLDLSFCAQQELSGRQYISKYVLPRVIEHQVSPWCRFVLLLCMLIYILYVLILYRKQDHFFFDNTIQTFSFF